MHHNATVIDDLDQGAERVEIEQQLAGLDRIPELDLTLGSRGRRNNVDRGDLEAVNQQGVVADREILDLDLEIRPIVPEPILDVT